jgi:hypothetical protein
MMNKDLKKRWRDSGKSLEDFALAELGPEKYTAMEKRLGERQALHVATVRADNARQHMAARMAAATDAINKRLAALIGLKIVCDADRSSTEERIAQWWGELKSRTISARPWVRQ